MKDFDIDDLMDLSTDKSFTRGEDYYESGCVKSIVKRGDFYEGIVRGSSSYKVTLDMSDSEPDFECTCPYDFGGICKHAVAFGLAVLDGNFDDKAVSAQKTNQLAPDKIKMCFENADTQKKLDFLKQILDKDTDLQSQFYEFSLSTNEKPVSISHVDIDKIKEELFDALTSIDFDYIFESHDPYSYGYYDDEGYIDDAYESILVELRPYTERAVNYFKKGNLTDGLRILTGMYEGIQNLPDIDDYNYDIFGDSYEFEVFELLKDEFKRAFDVFEATVKSEQHVKEAIDLLLSRYEYYQNAEQDEENEPFIYNLKVFERVFIALIINQPTAVYLEESMTKHKLENSLSMAYVSLKLAEDYGNEKTWIEAAEKFAAFESPIAKQLLEKYKIKNEFEDFNRISELVFSKWPDKFNLYLVDNLDKEAQKDLYLKALKHYTTHSRSIQHYKILREYLRDDERIKYVDNQKGSYDLGFYINLLEIEKRFADILKTAKAQNAYYSDYTFLLRPIVNIYPDDCFEIIKKVCNNEMTSPNRNRNTYERMAGLLNVMLKIQSKQNETLQYIRALYNHKPNLPALKDEFRKRIGGKYFS